jgi:phage terminase large subunit-like protein
VTTTSRLLARIQAAKRLKKQVQELRSAKRKRSSKSIEELAQLSLFDFIAEVSPHLERPDHLKPYADQLERAVAEDPSDAIEAVVAAPPQHGKTVVSIHAIVWWLIKRPTLWFAYATYSQTRAESVSRQARDIAERAGLEIGGTLEQWTLKQGGGCNWKGVGSGLTGEPISGFLLMDDVYKGPEDSNSKVMRDKVTEWRVSVCEVRVHPGAGRILMATRWHPDDESARCIAEGWKYINLPAIAENDNDPLGRSPGEALWPSKRPVEHLEKIRRNPRVGEYVWASLYQGRPRPRGGAVFGDAHWYKPSELPRSGYRCAHGVDLAYSKRTSADRSVILTVFERGGLLYIVDCIVRQLRSHELAPIGKKAQQRNPGPAYWYCQGPESGVADLLCELGFDITAKPTGSADKFMRAQPAATSWNQKKILVPSGENDEDPAPEWVQEFLSVIQAFTGVNDTRDDEVDALDAVHDELIQPPAGGGVVPIASYRTAVGSDVQDSFDEDEDDD